MKKITIKSLLSLFLVFLTLNSCEKTNDIESVEQKELSTIPEIFEIQDSGDGYYFSSDEALALASVLVYPSKDSKTGKIGSTSKIIIKKKTVPDKEGVGAFHIMNYEEGGFVIVSADKRLQPILSFGEEGSFDLESNEIPEGILSWLESTSEGITNLRKTKEVKEKNSDSSKNSSEIKYPSEALYSRSCDTQKLVSSKGSLESKCDGGDTGCTNTSSYYGPYMNSSWNQWAGFNNNLDPLNCTGRTGLRPPSGCVATAIGQVMRYHQSPSNYNWGNMPLNNNGSNEASRLLEDIGDAVNMNYACDGSGANTGDGVNALKNTFGYSSASYGSWNHSTTKSNLRSSRPVILAGNLDSSCFLWWCSYSGGHAWVVEGYRQHFYCSTGSGYTYYFMNWGWGGSSNGYYAYNNWDPSDPNIGNFDNNRRMLYNIIP
jgi:hypothetical protein